MKMLAKLRIDRTDDVFALRQCGRAASAVLGYDEADQVRFATALSELGREALLRKSGASASFRSDGGTLIVEIADFPRSGTGRGSGYEAAAKLLDEIAVTGEREERVTLVLRREPTPRSGTIDAKDLREAIARATPHEPLEELRLENRDLIATLNELRERQDQLVQLNAELEETNRGVMAMYTQLAGELEETNRGVVALYAELDDKSARLNEANQAKSRFLASVSHELRSPVNSILGLSRILSDPQGDPLSAEQRKQVSLITRSAGELLELVNALLDLAKAESGRLQPDVSTIDLPEIFSELRGSLRPLAREGVELTFEAPPGVSVQTDRLLFMQVLRNLITNALKFTPAGSVTVTATLPTPYELAIAVSDTGIGIAPENQEQIFEEFFQVRGPLQAQHKGSGLGLPYAKRVVSALGGTLGLESAEGRGSTFHVTLPVQWQALLTAAESPRRPAHDQIVVGTVLLMDDDEGFRVALRGMLQGIAARVLEAQGGINGLELMRTAHPDVALIDLRMPDMDGADVLAQMNADPSLRSIPGVIITSTEIDDGKRRTLGSACALMSKSHVSPEKLRAVIGSALEKAGTSR